MGKGHIEVNPVAIIAEPPTKPIEDKDKPPPTLPKGLRGSLKHLRRI